MTAKIENLKAIHNGFILHNDFIRLLVTAKIENLKAIHNTFYIALNFLMVVSDR